MVNLEAVPSGRGAHDFGDFWEGEERLADPGIAHWRTSIPGIMWRNLSSDIVYPGWMRLVAFGVCLMNAFDRSRRRAFQAQKTMPH